MLSYANADDADFGRLDEWTAADPFHKDTLSGSFWIPKPDEKGVKCITVADEHGVLFNLKLVNAMRVYVQFPPKPSDGLQERIRAGLNDAFGFVSAGAKRLGYHEMLFDSVSAPLIQFFSKFGFKPVTDTFKVGL